MPGKDASEAPKTFVSRVGSWSPPAASAGTATACGGAMLGRGSLGCGTPQLLLLEDAGVGSRAGSWSHGWVWLDSAGFVQS